jgi:hypothetical protein
MSKEKIVKDDLTIHKVDPSTESKIMVEEDVYIIVTQAFCPNGHNLVGHGTHSFDGFGGICVNVCSDDTKSMVEMSPFHGAKNKKSIDFPDGKKVKITCPECDCEFEVLSKCSCSNGELRKIYTSPTLKEAHMIAVCDQWGCTMSRVIDNNELFSEFVDSSWD